MHNQVDAVGRAVWTEAQHEQTEGAGSRLGSSRLADVLNWLHHLLGPDAKLSRFQDRDSRALN